MIRSLTLAGTALTALIASTALAQTEPVPAAPVETAAADDLEIVVTAQKRTERLQDVPVAVSVVSGATLEAQGGVNLENAQYLVPSLNFRKSGTSINQSLYLRGVGTATFSIAGEPSVSTVLDGVVYSRAGEAFSDLVDIERLEVLRGPQGTLFGKNASAGVVNIISRRPGDELGGFVEGGFFFDSGNEYRVRAALDLPFSDKVRSRFTGFYTEYDGNIFNETVGRRVNGYQRYGFRGIIEADPSETVSLTLIGDWRKADDDCCAEVIGTAPTGVGGLALAGIDFRGDRTRRIRQNLITRTEEESWGVSLQADIELGEQTVTSITAYRNYDNREIRDGDFVQAAFAGLNELHDDGPQSGDTFSQELRLTSPGNQFFDYVAGFYYSRADTERTFSRQDVVCNPAPTPLALVPCGSTGAPPSTFPFGTATFGSVFKNVAVFGQGTVNFTDRFRGIIGLRYTHDQLDVFHSRVTTLAGPGIQPNFDAGVFNGGLGGGVSNGVPFEARTTNDNWSGKVGAQFDVSDDSTLYGTYSRGYKGPAFNIFFNLTATGTNVIADETSDAYEIGLKNSLFGGRLVVNLAAYYAKYENFQANNPDLVAGVVVTRFTNAGDVSTRGGELDLLWRPLDDLAISGGVAYTDAKVDRFFLPPGGNPAGVIPPGTPLGYAPDWKGSLGVDYRLRTGGIVDVTFNAQGSYQSDQLSLFDANPAIRQAGTIQGYGLVDLSIGLIEKDDRYRLTFQVKNLFDESFAAAITNGGPGGSFRYLIPREADRYFGVTGRVNF